MRTDNKSVTREPKTAARKFYEGFGWLEPYPEFSARNPQSAHDLEIWKELDALFGEGDPLVRRRFKQAGQQQRKRNTTLEGYLRTLAESVHTREVLFELAGVSESEWTDWVLGIDNAHPTVEQVEALAHGLELSPAETRRFQSLRREAWKDSLAWQPKARQLTLARKRAWKQIQLALSSDNDQPLSNFLPDAERTVLPDAWDRLDDLWRDLGQLFADIAPKFRRQYVDAGHSRRWSQMTLESYFSTLCASLRLSPAGLAHASGAHLQEALDWLSGAEAPSVAQMQTLVEALQLGADEGELLNLLREDSLQLDDLDSGLSAYLACRPHSLAPALTSIRCRARLSTEAIARVADVCPLAWERWELRIAVPTADELRDALARLDWKLDGWRAELSGEPCARALWYAFRMERSELAGESYRQERVRALKARRRNDGSAKKKRQQRACHEIRLETLRATREASEETLSGFLAFRRKARELTVEQIAAQAGVDSGTWRAWEDGKRVPSMAEIRSIAPRIFATEYLRDKLTLLRLMTAA